MQACVCVRVYGHYNTQVSDNCSLQYSVYVLTHCVAALLLNNRWNRSVR